MMFERSWKYRRMAAFVIIGVGLSLLAYVVIFGVDDALRRDSVTTLAFIIMGAFATYMTGAVADDRFRGKELIATKAVDQSEPTTTDVEIKP
jgi:hypothetical protein